MTWTDFNLLDLIYLFHRSGIFSVLSHIFSLSQDFVKQFFHFCLIYIFLLLNRTIVFGYLKLHYVIYHVFKQNSSALAPKLISDLQYAYPTIIPIQLYGRDAVFDGDFKQTNRNPKIKNLITVCHIHILAESNLFQVFILSPVLNNLRKYQ